MKIKTVLISTVVTIGLVGGVVYGAYYSLRGKSSPVEVVPVANVNTNLGGSMDMMNSSSGTITSQVSQNVILDDEYSIDRIYVEAGDEVKEGDPLFSYDMTLAELQLEMEELNVQTQELNLKKLEKDLEKLKNTTATASLAAVNSSLTTSSDEEILDADAEAETSAHPAEESGGASESAAPGVSVEGVETVESGPDEETGGADSDADEETVTLRESVQRYELLIQSLGALIDSYAEELDASDIEKPVAEITAYYRKNLADEVQTQASDEGSAAAKRYELKETIKAVLSSSELETLQTYVVQMERCHAAYIDLLIRETNGLTGGAFATAAAQIQSAYQDLDADARALVSDTEALQRILAADAESGSAESGSETQPGEGSAESGSEAQQGSGSSEPGSETQPDTEGESETDGETMPDTEGESETNGETQSETGGEVGQETGNTEDTDSTELTEDTQQATPGTEPTEDASETSADGTEPTTQSPESESETESETETESAIPAGDLINNFLTTADALFTETASPSAEDYRSAIDFYQMYLGVPDADIADGTQQNYMDAYGLNDAVRAYLTELGSAGTQLQQQLTGTYQQICMAYVKTMVLSLDPKALTREGLTAAQEAYDLLGTAWQVILEDQYQKEQEKSGAAAGAVQSGTDLSGMDTSGSAVAGTDASADGLSGTDTSGSDLGGTDLSGSGLSGVTGSSQSNAADQSDLLSPAQYPSLADRLIAYDMILQIQELDQNQEEEALIAALTALRDSYLALSDTQKALVWNADVLIALLQQYGLWQEETEPMTEDYSYGDGGLDGDTGLTAEEIKEQIASLEQQIRVCKLDIRQYELNVKQKQRIVDGKIVKSTMDGTVVSVGSADGTSEDEYFVKVTSQVGLYAEGTINEFARDQIHVGDTISGTSETGMGFTAVIKEIQDYPSSDGNNSYGTENTNSSYYPFYALIDDPEGIEEGWAELQISYSGSAGSNNIWLERYFVRTDNVGKNYVYVQGEDGLLTRRDVVTGQTYYNTWIEITSGLDTTDRIAFPYGDEVKEGAKTEEVDSLENAYG